MERRFGELSSHDQTANWCAVICGVQVVWHDDMIASGLYQVEIRGIRISRRFSVLQLSIPTNQAVYGRPLVTLISCHFQTLPVYINS